MNANIVKAMIRKDLRDIFRTKSLLATIIIIPVLFSVLLPGILLGSAVFFNVEKALGNDMGKLLEMFLSQTNGILFENAEQQLVYIFVNYLLPSFFLLVPIITASVVAANSFVGEKERRTLESLLFSPIPVKTLFISKTLASFIPSFLVSILSFILCGFVINLLGYQLFGEMIFPTANWLVLITCLSPMVTLLTVLLNIFISARVKTFQEAQNIGGLIILPVIAMIAGQAGGLFIVGPLVMFLLSAAVLAINLVLLQRITKMNDRHVLFEKQIH
ncbi:ABC transporter permease subunit [Bacillus sp. FJAT-27251]|uniref:ABC transporter permease subunit n=1 Tax=Bacillus sp. FJAT-27251 TaxID=1684142 RepID=UPI0006A79836|nr:ABC transporter permease subunit [Bacillus sp. FJAT-27251]